MAAGGAVLGGLAAAEAFSSSCNLSSLQPVSTEQTSFVYAADGSLLGAIPAERNRQPVALRDVSAWMRKATVAIEDRRFYTHGGVDYEGIARALWRDVTAGRVDAAKPAEKFLGTVGHEKHSGARAEQECGHAGRIFSRSNHECTSLL